MRAGIAYLLASRRRAAEAEGCWLALILSVCLSHQGCRLGRIIQEEIMVLMQ